ncbi:hypothetical protein ACIBW9_12400 [Streptomyces sp. NPDC049541]|uniref:hypothetical protein n=1 Tax=Streptomyces sp. NPDC049541 TaxID=3365594 RepID=UPI0037911AE3
MRRLYVPVRLAATVMAVAAAAGCMSVGEDGAGGAKPSHSAGQRGGEAPDGGSGVSGRGFGAGVADGKHKGGKRDKEKDGKSASPSASPSAGDGRSAPPAGKPGNGKSEKPGVPAPTVASPTPTHTAEPQPTPTEQPTPASPEPTVAEPSSSAHEETAPQWAEREPAPTAGSPA